VASVEQHRNAWRVRWRDASGRQHARSFPRKSDATAYASIVEADKLRGVGLDPAGGRITFDAYATAWQARQVWRPSTRKSQAHALTGLPFGPRALTAIRHREIQGWIAEITPGLSPTTVESRFRAVTAVFRAARRDKLVADLPTEGVRLPSRTVNPSERAVALGPAQVAALLEQLPAGCWSDYATVIALTGLRASEAAGITADRVVDGSLIVDRQLTRDDGTLGPVKTAASSRVLPLSDRVLEVLAARPVDPATGLVFTSRHRRPLGHTTRGDAWRKARTALEGTEHALPPAARGWHTLRHTYASTALAAGIDPATLSRMLGHATVAETLMTYSHMIPGAAHASRNVVADALGL